MKLIRRFKQVYIFIIGTLVFYSCKEDRWDIKDDKLTQVQIPFNRFDKEFNTVLKDSFERNISTLINKYPTVFEAIYEVVFNANENRLDSFQKVLTLKKWFSNPYVDSLFSDVQKKFPDAEVTKIEKEVSNGFSRILHFSKGEKIPKIYIVNTVFGYQCITYEDDLLLNLDLYLGSDYKYYYSYELNFPLYQIRRFTNEYIPSHILKTWYQWAYDEKEFTDKTLLSKMLYLGKMHLLLDIAYPDMNDSLKIEYTKAQIDWCIESEAQIWKHFSGKDVLFKTDQGAKIAYLNEAPFTNAEGLPQNSSPRLGEWLGWQIIKSYMKSNPNVTLKELLQEKDYQKILKLSRYKPR